MSTSNDTSGGEPAAASPPITFEAIRERAYELWERHHRPDGFEVELWLMAERELRTEAARRRAGEGTTDAARRDVPR